jgi:mRNA interferase MazF
MGLRRDYVREEVSVSVKRGDVVYVNLIHDNAFGAEQKGLRPSVVIQNDIGNEYSSNVIVATLTSKDKKYLPTHVKISPTELNGLEVPSTIQMEHLRTVSKDRLGVLCGKLTDNEMAQVDKALAVSIGLVGMSPDMIEQKIKSEVELRIKALETTKEEKVIVEPAPLILIDVICEYIESSNNIKLMNYQRDLVKAFFESDNVFVSEHMGKSTILKGVSEYFKSLDAKTVNELEADIVFNVSTLFNEALRLRGEATELPNYIPASFKLPKNKKESKKNKEPKNKKEKSPKKSKALAKTFLDIINSEAESHGISVVEKIVSVAVIEDLEEPVSVQMDSETLEIKAKGAKRGRKVSKDAEVLEIVES